MSIRHCGAEDPINYAAGRATVHDGAGDDGRAGMTDDERSLTSWLVWDWSRAVDERLDVLAADTFDLADRIHYLNITITSAFIIIVIGLSILIGVVIL